MARRKKQDVPVPEEQSAAEQAAESAAEQVSAAAEAPADVLASPLPTEEERRVAAAAHGGILLNLITGIGGPVLALILWLFHEKESEYAGWHALQALIFQGVSLLATLVLGGLATVLWVVTIPLFRFVVGFCLLPFALGFTLITVAVVIGSLIYGCSGALAVLEGQDFRYRWVADIIPPLTKP